MLCEYTMGPARGVYLEDVEHVHDEPLLDVFMLTLGVASGTHALR